MNYYLDAKLQLFKDELNKLKSEGAINIEISIDTAIDILSNIQSINKGEAIKEDFVLDNYLKGNKEISK